MIDSHPCDIYTYEGKLALEGSLDAPVTAPWGISYAALLPESEPRNLIAAVCVSSSHVAWSSLRTEVTLMAIGQAAGEASVVAVQSHTELAEVTYSALRSRLNDAHAAIAA
jgi:hypothetical protein